MRARAVIGTNFGDEGKGLVTDYLCAIQGAGMVVRFNGGAQAGHTVVTPQGQRHVFSHFGSGTLWGTPTFLSQFFVCNPIAFLKEFRELQTLCDPPLVYAHPNCLITTFADMMINQMKEDARAGKRHGSCGMGVHETMERSEVDNLKITMSDLWNDVQLKDKLNEICGRWAEFRTKGKKIEKPEAMIEEFINRCKMFAELVHPLGIQQCEDPVFEGAQGLLLDQMNKKYWPHVTHSRTGIHNVRILCQQAGIENIDAYYVSRTYLTRHGAGPLPDEDPKLRYFDNTNVPHPYQGKLRFAPLDRFNLIHRCAEDYGDAGFKLVLTHCDQKEPGPLAAHLYSYGPTRVDVADRQR